MIKVAEKKRLKLAVLASGRGSNFLALQDSIKEKRLNADICVLISDKKNAPALDRAREEGIEAYYINPAAYESRDDYEKELVKKLQAEGIDIVVLAGYMRLVGRVFLEAFKYKVINIHPALLPSFTGLHAQKQAVDYGVKYSGCTVHFVDEGMDTGPIIMQSAVAVYSDDTEDSLADRILLEEHKIYALALQLIAEGRVFIKGRKVIIAD